MKITIYKTISDQSKPKFYNGKNPETFVNADFCTTKPGALRNLLKTTIYKYASATGHKAGFPISGQAVLTE